MWKGISIRLAVLTGISTCFAGVLQPQTVYDLPAFAVNAGLWGDVPGQGDLHYLPSPDGGGAGRTLAHVLGSISGLNFHQRGSGSLEPNIRGFSMDRLTTSFNGHYLPIAAPTRTASPVNFFGPVFPGKVAIMRGFSPVRFGPVPTGGRIDVDTFPDISPGEVVLVTATINPDGGIAAVHGNMPGDNPSADYLISAYAARSGSYDSGGGLHTVDTDYAATGATAALSVRPWGHSELRIAINYHSQDKANNPSLPLDADATDAIFVTANWIQELFAGLLDLGIGYADISQQLSSKGRTIAAAAPIEAIFAESDADSVSLRAAYGLPLSAGVSMTSGVDLTRQSRDAVRQRRFKSGELLLDHVWPAIEVIQPGIFVELSGGVPDTCNWLLGARIENTSMDVGRPNASVSGIPGSQGVTIADNYRFFNAGSASTLDNGHITGSLQASLVRSLGSHLSIVAGGEYTVAPPGPGETYRAFLNALGGGVEIGNPWLETEKKRSVSFGLNYNIREIRFSTHAWFADIDDFISRVMLQEQPLIYSFRNLKADFHGMDTEISFTPFPGTVAEPLSIQLRYSRTNGKESASGMGLPEVPPWQAGITIGWNDPTRTCPVSARLDLRYTAAGINPQPSINPVFVDSGAYTTIGLTIQYRIMNRLDLTITLENLLDKLAYNYLQPPVATGPVMPSGGTLGPGERIPLPGRSVSFGFRSEF